MQSRKRVVARRAAGVSERETIKGALHGCCRFYETGRFMLLLFTLAVPPQAYAQEVPGDVGGFTRLGSFPNLLPFEHLDTQNAQVILRFTALSLPGHRGRNLEIEYGTRSEIPSVWWGIASVPAWVQEGTYTGYESNIYENRLNALMNNGPKLGMADGSTRQMYFETWPRPTPIPDPETGLDPTYRYAVSTERLRWDAVARVLHLPDGSRCHYGHGGPPVVRRLTSCADAFGVFLTVSYTPTGMVVRQVLGGSVEAPTQYREIEFDGGEMRYEGRVWTFGGTGLQRTVQMPGVSTPWAFEWQQRTSSIEPFHGTHRLSKVITPGGGEIAYQYQERTSTVPGDELSPGFDVSHGWFLATRTVGGTGIASGTWTFDQLEFDRPFDQAPQSFRVQSPAAGAAVGEATYFLNRRASDFNEVGALVGSGWVNTSHGSATSGQDTTFTERVLVHYPAGTMFPVLWGSITLTTLTPVITSDSVCSPGPAACTVYELEREDVDAFGNTTRLIERSMSRPGVERVTELTYFNQTGDDELYLVGLPLTSTVAVGTDVVSTTRNYDPATGFLNWTIEAGVRTNFAPDSKGNVATSTIAPSTSAAQVTSYTYDWGVVNAATTAAGTVHRVVNPDGTIASHTEGYGSSHPRTSEFEYDLGRLVLARPPGGGVPVTTAYDPTGGSWITTTRGAARALTVFDGFGRPTTTYDGTISAYLAKVSNSYYPDGRVQCAGLVVAADTLTNLCTVMVYDDVNRLVTETLPDQATRSRSWQVVDGAVRTEVVDERGRQTFQTRRGVASPGAAPVTTLVDASAETWTYTYDDVSGALTQVAGPGGVTRSWTFEPGTKRLTTETHPESGLVEFEYWESGLLKEKKDARQTTFLYDYDGAGRLETVTATRGTTVYTTTYEFYPQTNDLKQLTAPGVTTLLTYDGAGRVSERTDTIDGDKEFAVSYTYDAADNLSTVTYPSGRVVGYAYDAENQLARVCRGPCTGSPGGSDYAHTFAYHPSGALEGYTAGNGVVSTFAYHPEHQRLQTLTAGTGANRLELEYDYDLVGNVTEIADVARPEWTQTFTYDAVDRLWTASAPSYGSLTYTYDAHGNRQTGNGVTYTYPTNPFRLASIQVGSQSPLSMSYDANGNLETVGSNLTYTHTADNQLRTAVTTANGPATHYSYDAEQWRVKKAVPDQPTVYYVRGPGGLQLSEWTNASPSPTSALVRDYIYAGGRLIGVASTTQTAK